MQPEKEKGRGGKPCQEEGLTSRVMNCLSICLYTGSSLRFLSWKVELSNVSWSDDEATSVEWDGARTTNQQIFFNNCTADKSTHQQHHVSAQTAEKRWLQTSTCSLVTTKVSCHVFLLQTRHCSLLMTQHLSQQCRIWHCTICC